MFKRLLIKARKFTALSGEQKRIFIQAWFMLGWFRAAILIVSFRRLTSSLVHHRDVPDVVIIDDNQLKQAIGIGKLVATAARYTPWHSRCLMQVLVVQRLLVKHNIAGQFYLAVRKGSDDGVEPTDLSAHAWLQCNDAIVNGAYGHEAYTIVSTFSWGRRRD